MRSLLKKAIISISLVACLVNLTGMSKAIQPVTTAVTFVASKIMSLFGGNSSTGACVECAAARESLKTPGMGTEQPVWQYQPKGESWTNLTLDAIDREGLANTNPKDAAVYCPNWKNLTYEQKRLFWLQFSSKLSEIESGFRVSESFTEPNGTLSVGLFSMSRGDCSNSRYYISSVADAYNEKKNIDCAIHTMRGLLSSSGNYIGTGGNKGLGSYWQPLQDYPTSYVAQTRRNKREILDYTRALPYCKDGSTASMYIMRDVPGL